MEKLKKKLLNSLCSYISSAKWAVLCVISVGNEQCDAMRAGVMLHLDFLQHPIPSGGSYSRTQLLLALSRVENNSRAY